MYLRRALEEFHHSANGPELWVEVHGPIRGSPLLEGAQAKLTAVNRRLHFLRSAILFAAIAAEAFANELLDDLLSRADAEALDKLEPAEKLLMGTRLASGVSPLDRGSEPMQGLVKLAQTRNRLVHPRPAGGYAAWAQDLEPRDDEGIGPAAACKAILTVADAIVACNPLREHARIYGAVARTIARHRSLVEGHQARAGYKIMDLPAEDDEGVPDLFGQTQESVRPAQGTSQGTSERAPSVTVEHRRAP
jgi:hypothetical protein